jgi:hypothetical protein
MGSLNPVRERSKALSESTNREATNHGKNDYQINTPDPLSLKFLHGSRLHYFVLSSKSCFLAHTGTQSSMLPPATCSSLLHDLLPFTLKCQGILDPCISRTHSSHWSMGNRRHKPSGLVLLCLQIYCTLLLEVYAWQASPRTPATHRLCSPWFQQLIGLLEVHGLPQVRPKGLYCLVSTRRFKPSGFIAPQAHSTCYSVQGASNTHASEPQVHALLFCWC